MSLPDTIYQITPGRDISGTDIPGQDEPGYDLSGKEVVPDNFKINKKQKIIIIKEKNDNF